MSKEISKEVKKFRVEFNVPEYNKVMTFTKQKSGACEYGNQTMVVIDSTYDNGRKEQKGFDTRYDKSVNNFDKWCNDYLDNAFNQDYEPRWTEVKA